MVKAHNIHGHLVVVSPCDGLRDHWRVRADGHFLGLISSDSSGYHASACPCWRPAYELGLLHRPTSALAIEALVDATVGAALDR